MAVPVQNAATLSLTVGEGEEVYSGKDPTVGFTSATKDGGPFGKLSPAKFLDTGINRLWTACSWGADKGYYWTTFLCFYSYAHPTANSIELTRLDTGAKVTLKPYYGSNDGYRNNNSKFFTPADIGKTFSVRLRELGGVSLGYLRKFIRAMLRSSTQGAQHDLAQASPDGLRFGPETQGHHLHESSRRRLVCHERQAHVRSAGRLTKDELIQCCVRAISGLLGHSGRRSTDQSGDRYETRLLRRGNVERCGRFGHIGLGQLLSAYGELQCVASLGVRDRHFSGSQFRLAANAAFAKEAA